MKMWKGLENKLFVVTGFIGLKTLLGTGHGLLTKMAAEALSGARFSQTEKDVIERKLGVTPAKAKTREELEEFYEIDSCVKAITQNGFTKVRIIFDCLGSRFLDHGDCKIHWEELTMFPKGGINCETKPPVVFSQQEIIPVISPWLPPQPPTPVHWFWNNLLDSLTYSPGLGVMQTLGQADDMCI